MSPHPPNRSAGFTLGELLIGVSLSMIVMAAVLSSYVFVARSYTKTIGFGLPNQPTLEAQGRRTLATIAQDVQGASAIGNPTSSGFTLTVPLSTGGTKQVTYSYNSTNATIERIDSDTTLTLHSSLLTCSFIYYDAYGNPYTTYTNYAIGIKQISLALTAQAGNSASNTQTMVYNVTSPRYLFRNKSLLP